MCGIAGLIVDELDPRTGPWLSLMTQRLYHRGPNDGGAVVFGPNGAPAVQRRLGAPGEAVRWGHVPARVGLGSRRLSIIDLSDAGHQPMAAPDGHAWLAFNGEIYNHAELRSELQGRGLLFRGLSDTEVLLAAWRAWGGECFRRLEGMWGLAIVDWTSGRVVLSRDRVGIKPLYVTRFDDGVAFASEIGPLLQLPGARRGVNEARLRDFLVDGRVDHTDDTLFEGVWSVPAGCWIEFDLRRRSAMRAAGAVHRYWDPEAGWEHDEADADRAGVRAALAEAVRSHLRSDVPVGSCLSGGLDSSSIVALIDAARRDGMGGSAWSQHVFTAVLPGSNLDEGRHADAVVQAIAGLEPHRVAPSAERLLGDMDRLIDHQEQPFGSPSIYMQWEVMRLARETGVTVLLDGQGGDELFCGYEGYWPAYLAHLLRRGRLVSLVREFRRVDRACFSAMGLAARTAAHLVPDGVRAIVRRRWSARRMPWLARELFDVKEGPGLCDALGLAPPTNERPGRRAPGVPMGVLRRGPLLARHLWRQVLADSLPSLLRFEDRNSMAFSIEARVPFLDRAMVERAMSLRPERKMANGRMKVILREAMRGLVPDAILERRDKIGFAAPTMDWMQNRLRPWWYELISSASFRERGCFESAGVDKLSDAVVRGDEGAATCLWRVAIVEAWARRFLDGAMPN